MDKKRLTKALSNEDIKGFEEFIEGEPESTSFLPKPPAGSGSKKETSFEHFTFLSTDNERLWRLKNLLNDKLPFASKHEQGPTLMKEQQEDIEVLRKKLFEICDRPASPYRKSIQDIFDLYFSPLDS